MALDHRSALIRQGWARALLLLAVYLLLSITAASYFHTLESWIAASFVVGLATVYVFRVYIDRKNFLSLGLHLSGIYPHAITGLLSGTALLVFGALMIYTLDGLRWTSVQFNGRSLLMSAVILLLVSFTEELVFRGYILRNLTHSVNKWTAILISTALFAAVHTANAHIPATGVLSIFAGGWLMGVVFIHTHSLWFPIAFHFSWNFLQGTVLGFPVSGLSLPHLLEMDRKGPDLLTGGAFGFEGSLVCTLLLTAVAGIVSYIHLRRSP